ncbi:MAG: dTMP kinase, partial [Gammaproteobacteria bacterium]|nr:dTMP kinase [Gammaproteobacteria bacterium]
RERAGKRSAPDRIEKEKNDFFDRVRNAYLDMAKRHPERICTVDASVALEQVQAQIKQQLRDRGII